MKKLIVQHWKSLALLVIVNVLTLVGILVKVNYDLTTPAMITNVSNVIDIEDNEKCNVNTVSVYSYSKINLLDYLFGLINPYATIDETYEYSITNSKVMYSSGIVQKRVSIYNAIIAGYKRSGYNEIVDENSYQGYIIHTLYSYSSSKLKIGDIITSFNGTKLEGHTGKNEFVELVSKIIYEKGKTYPITVNRKYTNSDGSTEVKELTFDIMAGGYYLKDNIKYASFGISTYEYIVPVSNTNIPSYSWNYGDSVGPSGGLMQALHIYDCLTNNRLTKGLKIVGTGTVDAYGNAGAIGGIYQKVITAHLSKADIFIVPVSSLDENVYKNESNYIEAMKAYNSLDDTNMKIVIASSLDDIVKYLQTY